MTVADGRPGECDWIAYVSGPALLPISGVPAGWTSLTAEVVTSLKGGTVIETAPVSGTAPDVTVSLSGAQVAAIGSGVRWWRLLNAGVPVIVGRWVADASGADSTSAVSVTVAGGVVVTVQGATGSTGASDHGALTGLGDDDHTQYLTSGRHGAISGNPHNTTAAHVGADPSGTASTAIAAHLAAPDPHTQYLTSAEGLALPFDASGTAAGLVSTEASTRSSADTSLSSRIAAIEGLGSLATDAELAAEATARTTADGLRALKAGDQFTGNVGIGVAPTVALDVIGRMKLQDSAARRNLFMLGGTASATGADNMVIGTSAGVSLGSGSDNCFVGGYAGFSVVGGSANCFVGSLAGFSVSSGARNVGIGDAAGRYTTTGSYNVSIGANTGPAITVGAAYSGSVSIGTDSGGVGARAGGSNEIRIGTPNHSTILDGAFQVKGNAHLGASASFGGGVGVLAVSPATTAPTSNPASGFICYVDPADGAFKVRGASGTITTLALA